MPTTLVLAAVLGIGLTTAGQPPVAGDALSYPLISGYGGVAAVPDGTDPPRKGARVVFDVTADAKPGEVNKGLDRVARLVNLYGAAGLKPSDVRVTVVLHGEATTTALSDAAYAARHKSERNPNLPLVRELKKAGVEVLVCGQALHYKGFDKREVAAEVSVAVAAVLVVVNRQADGYAYVPAQ